MKVGPEIILLFDKKNYVIPAPRPGSKTDRFKIMAPKSNPKAYLAGSNYRAVKDLLVKKGTRLYFSPALLLKLHGNNSIRKAYIEQRNKKRRQ